MTRLILVFVLSIAALALSVYWKNNPRILSKETLTKRVEDNLENEVRAWRVELEKLSATSDSDEAWLGVNNSYFLWDSTGVKRWSTNKFFPDPLSFDNDSIEYFNNGSNHYLVLQKLLPQGKILTSFLTLQESFSVQNQFLSTNLNSKIFPVNGVAFQSTAELTSISLFGRRLFSISVNPVAIDLEFINTKAWLAFSVGLLLLLWASWNIMMRMLNIQMTTLSICFCFITLLGVRFLMVYGKFPELSPQIAIFNPAEFASSTFNNSIGNLLLNTIALLGVALFTLYASRKLSLEGIKRMSKVVKTMAAAILFLLCFASQLLPFLYLETIYHNSEITPDIAYEISFDPVRLAALSCILLSCIASVIYLISFFGIAARLIVKDVSAYVAAIFIATASFIAYHFLTDRNYEIPFWLTIINLIALVLTSTNRKTKAVFSGITYFIFFQLAIYGLQISLAIRWLSMERERESMTKFANTFLVERDVLGEYLLDQAITRIEEDAFIKQQMVNPFNRLSLIDQKIRNTHLNSYFDRYNIHISLYDNSGANVESPSDLKLPALIQQFVPLAESTGYHDIYIIRNPVNNLVKRYMAVIPVKYHVAGYIVIDMVLQHVLPSSVFPKLLLDSRFSSYASSLNYSYGVIRNDSVISSAGDFNYQNPNLIAELKNDNLFSKSATFGGYDHVGVSRENGQITLVSTRHYSSLNCMANFSFYFLIASALIVLALSTYYLTPFGTLTMSYSNRIQLYVYSAMMLPLIALTITTLRVSSFSETRRSEDGSKVQARNLALSLGNALDNGNQNIEELIKAQALGIGEDVTVYDKQGLVVASSEPEIYSSQILSRFIDPRAMRLISAGNFSFSTDESLGKLKFRNTYSAILSPMTKEVLGVISIPFFASQESFEKDQIRLVLNILAVFIIVFLLFYLASFIALSWLVRPLNAMSASLRQTTLSGTNKKLIWNSSDEIGSMVKEYNTMIDNLIKSREELERRQREATWREMARQVAHEIKNPLTPIKLTLQQLQNSIQSGQSDSEKVNVALGTILHQVDILNDIASSFAAFAQMPEPKLERINIIELLQEVVSLHNTSSARPIEVSLPDGAVWVMADQRLFSRVFSNIILNAYQSEVQGRSLKMEIGLKLHPPNLTLFFRDNGRGMTQEVLDKIFIPYFSTKESGSGLGLAIAKQGIEQAGGRIWCESSLGSGTTFLISLPLAQ